MDAKLVVVGGKANKAEVKLKLPTVVGRGRDADLTVAHGTVSRHHCLIYEVEGALIVRDNGSLNGTLIGGERINEALLKPGDTLTVGPLTFRADYEHNGGFPSLGDQPTIPNFQDTVGDEAASVGAGVAADTPASSDQEPGQFDFLGGASATAPTVEEDEGLGIPNFEQPAAAEESAEDAPAATSGEQTLDFLAGGSDVAPVSDDDAPGFDFLNQTASAEQGVAGQASSFDSLAESTTAKQEEAISDAPAIDAPSESQSSGGTATPEADFPANDAAAEAVEPPEPEAVADAAPDEAAAEAAGGFDFLNAAEEGATDEPAATMADQSPQNEPAADDEPLTTAEVGDETVAEAGGFDSLDHAQPAAEEAAPVLNFEAAAAETEAAAETADAGAEPAAAEPAAEQASHETPPVEKPEGGFDFLNADDEDASDQAVADTSSETLESDLHAPEATAEEAATEDEEERGLPQFDMTAETPEGGASDAAQDQAAEDDSPSFGFLGNMASEAEAESDEPEAASPELTLHDPEVSDDEVAGLGDSPELGGESSLKFDDDNSPPTASSGGFDFLAAGDPAAAVREEAESFPSMNGPDETARTEPELTAFAADSEPQSPTEPDASLVEPTSAEESDLSASVNAADDELESNDDSGETGIPLTPPTGEGADAGSFSFLNETPAAEAAEQGEASSDDGAEGYAISQEPVAPAPQQSFPMAGEAETPEDELVAEEEAAAVDEDLDAEPSVDSQPQDAKSKKQGWWPFGKSKDAAPANAKDKVVDKPAAQPPSDMQAAGSQPNFNPSPAADDDEAALGFLSDSPAASSDDFPALPNASNGNGKKAGGESAGSLQNQADDDGKGSPSGGDDELNNFFESIGLD